MSSHQPYLNLSIAIATPHPTLTPMHPANSQDQPSRYTLPPAQVLAQMSNAEQIRLIMSHPFFTGRCPQCRRSMQIAQSRISQCTCGHCGWSDQVSEQVS